MSTLPIRRLEEILECKQKELEQHQMKLESKYDPRLSLAAIKLQKEVEKKKYDENFFRGLYIIKIWALEEEIKELRKIEDLEDDIERCKEEIIEQSLSVWGGFPTILDKTVYDSYAELIRNFVSPVTPDVPFINIIVVGENGSGKSSFLNTCATALENSKDIRDTYRVSSGDVSEQSATSRMHLKPLYLQVGDEKKMLHVKFYDMPGIAENNNVRGEELHMVINGEIKSNAKITKASQMRMNNEFLRENPTPADQMHCILYFVKATSNIEMSPLFKIMQGIRNSKKSDDDVKQFAIVTAIDRIGVPNEKMEKAYRYPCFKQFCKDVSEALDFDEYHVIPVSNYCSEGRPNNAKNAMSLVALWRVLSSGKEYIEQKWGRRIPYENFDS